MKNISKKLLSLALAVLMLIAAVPFSVLSVTAEVPHEYEGYIETKSASAVSTDNPGVTWAIYTSLDGKDQKLVISGEGALATAATHTARKEQHWSNKNDHPWASYYSTITSLVVEDGITSTCMLAFGFLTKLTDVSLPSSLEYLGYQLFNGCTALKRVVIPSTVKRVDNQTFRGCTALEYVIIETTAVFSDEGADINNVARDATNFNKAAKMFENNSTLKCIYFPYLTKPTKVNKQILQSCTSTSVKIVAPKDSFALTADAYGAAGGTDYPSEYVFKSLEASSNAKAGFVYNSGNADGTVNNSIMYVKSLNSDGATYTLNIVGSGAMNNSQNTNRTKPYMSDVSTLNNPSDTEITKIIVDSAITDLGTYAFYGMKALTDFQWNPTATEPKILAQVFRNCTALKEITLPNGLNSLYSSLFQGCSSLKTVNIPSTVDTVGSGVFEGTEVEFLVLPKAVTTINKNAFSKANSLKAIFVQGSAVTTWGTTPFANTSNLTVYTDDAKDIPTDGVKISVVKGLDVTANVKDIMTKCLLSVEAFAYYNGDNGDNRTGIRALITADETIRTLLEDTLGQTVEYGFIAGNKSFADGTFTLDSQKTIFASVYTTNSEPKLTYNGKADSVDLTGKHAFCAVLYNIKEDAEYVLTGYVKIGESVTEATNNTSFSVGNGAFAGASVEKLQEKSTGGAQ